MSVNQDRRPCYVTAIELWPSHRSESTVRREKRKQKSMLTSLDPENSFADANVGQQDYTSLCTVQTSGAFAKEKAKTRGPRGIQSEVSVVYQSLPSAERGNDALALFRRPGFSFRRLGFGTQLGAIFLPVDMLEAYVLAQLATCLITFLSE